MIDCMETKVSWAPAQKAASRVIEVESASPPDVDSQGDLSDGKSWSKAPLLALVAAAGLLAGFAWLYYDSVAAIQTALSIFKL